MGGTEGEMDGGGREGGGGSRDGGRAGGMEFEVQRAQFDVPYCRPTSFRKDIHYAVRKTDSRTSSMWFERAATEIHCLWRFGEDMSL